MAGVSAKVAKVLGSGCLIAVLVFLGLTVSSLIYKRRSRTLVCIKCGARQKETWSESAGRRQQYFRNRWLPPVAGLYVRVLGPCEHRWAPMQTASRDALHGRRVSPGAPLDRYPIANPPDDVFQGLALVPNDTLRARALRCLSDGSNELRFLVQDLLHRLGRMNRSERTAFRWDPWWAACRGAFVIVTDPTEAHAIQKQIRQKVTAPMPGAAASRATPR